MRFDEVGKVLGIGTAEAYALVQEAQTDLPRAVAAEALATELERLDAMTRGLWPDASKGKPESVKAMLAVMTRRAKYLGLDAPTRSEIAGPGGVPLVSTDDLAARIATLAAAALKGEGSSEPDAE